MIVIDNILDGLAIEFQHARVEMHRLLCSRVSISDKFGTETLQGMIESRRRCCPRMKDNYSADWKALLQQKVKGKCHYLGLTTQRGDQYVRIIWHCATPLLFIKSTKYLYNALHLRRTPMVNLLPAILVGGPPHAGKSVLFYRLTQALRARGLDHHAIRACPDGEGN